MPTFVSEASMEQVVVNGADPKLQEILIKYGYEVATSSGVSILVIAALTNAEKAELFARLRDEGVCFSAGPGWSPSEVFEYLRDEGLIVGSYRRIAWRSPGNMNVVEDC